MQIDPNLIPLTLDLYHLILAGLAGVFLLLLLLCLLVMIPLARRRPPAPVAVAVPEKKAVEKNCRSRQAG